MMTLSSLIKETADFLFTEGGLGRPKKVPSVTLDIFLRSILPWSNQDEKMIFVSPPLFSVF
jgi:hypothetical protein